MMIFLAVPIAMAVVGDSRDDCGHTSEQIRRLNIHGHKRHRWTFECNSGAQNSRDLGRTTAVD